MTLSSFLIRPAQCATFTTSGLSNQVVTASPAIFIGYQSTVVGSAQVITIKNGNAGSNILKEYPMDYNGNTGTARAQFSLAPTGVDCPLGIYIDTPWIGAGSATNFSVSIYYILK